MSERSSSGGKSVDDRFGVAELLDEHAVAVVAIGVAVVPSAPALEALAEGDVTRAPSTLCVVYSAVLNGLLPRDHS